MRVLVTADYRSLSHAAGEVVLKAIRAKPEIVLGLPTGSTPLGMYEEIVTAHAATPFDVSRIRTFNLDEYLGLPTDHPKSYHTYMRERLFAHLPVPANNVEIPNGSSAADADTEGRRYKQAIQNAGGIDLLIVGIGANGHIAFNEPGSAFDSRTRAVDLSSQTIANAQIHFGSEPAPTRAMTMGIGTILEARRILLLASGAAKADAVGRALRGPVTESTPASALQLHQNVLVIVDEAAKKKF